MRDDLDGELSDRLAELEGWPVPCDPEPVVWADDDAGPAASGAGEEAGPPAAERF